MTLPTDSEKTHCLVVKSQSCFCSAAAQEVVETGVRILAYPKSVFKIPVVRMLSPVGIDHLEGAIVALQGEVHLEDVSAGLDDLQDAVRLLHLLLPVGADILHVLIDEHVLGEHAGLVEEVLDHLEEAGVLGLRDVDEALGDGKRSCSGAGSVDVSRLLDGEGPASLLQQVAGPLALPQHLHQAACHLLLLLKGFI